MNIKPEGLILPDCHCFREKAEMMNVTVDKIMSLYLLDVIVAADKFNFCEKSMDYYIASMIWGLVSLRIKKNKEDKEPLFGDMNKMYPVEFYRKEFEAVYDRLRPLVMQRIDYADGVLMGMGK